MSDGEGEAVEVAGKGPNRVRVVAMLGVVALLMGWLVLSDDGEIGMIVTCAVGGSGRSWVPGEAQDFEGSFQGFEYEGSTSNLIDTHVFAYGGYELPVLYAVRDALEAARGGEGVVVDVGANVGTHTMYWSRHAKHVHAIEPWPTIAKRLHDHLESNAITNVTVHHVGYSDEPGTMPFHVPPGFNQGWGSFSKSYQLDNYTEDDEVLDLPLVRGDDHLKEAGVARVDAIKADIEGYEKLAFEGLGETMKRDRPLAVFELNVLNEEGFKSAEQLRATFPEDYVFYEIQRRAEMTWSFPNKSMMLCVDPEGHYDLVPFDMTFARDGRNLMAVPKELDAKIPKALVK